MICFRKPPKTPAVGKHAWSAAEVANAMSYLAESTQEEIHALMVDARNRIRADYMVAKGSQGGVNAGPSEILQAVLLHGYRRFIMVHHHPSGDPTPSSEDVRYTEEIGKAARCTGLSFLDHIVIGKNYEDEFFFVSLRTAHPSMFG